MNSTHKVEVIEIDNKSKHGNADSLSIINACGYPVVVRTDDWAIGDIGAYVPPDNLVPLDSPYFSFLRGKRTPKVVNGREYHLVRAAKLRGVSSQGLLVKLTDGVYEVGSDVSSLLGIIHYEPEEPGVSLKGGPQVKAPRPFSVFDIDAYRKNAEQFKGRYVYVTEKIHGSQARYAWQDKGLLEVSGGQIRVGSMMAPWRGRNLLAKLVGAWKGRRRVPWYVRYLHVGSKNTWKAYDETCPWWNHDSIDDVASMLKENPDLVVFGEIHNVQKGFSYGKPPGKVGFAAFDLKDDDGFLDYTLTQVECNSYGILVAPVIYEGPDLGLEEMAKFAEGESVLASMRGAKHIREGVVVKTAMRYEEEYLNMKIVGQGYLERE